MLPTEQYRRVTYMEENMGRIVTDPDVLNGKPIIKGTQIPVYLIIELLAQGMTEKEILKLYAPLQKEDIKAALLYAAKLIDC